MKTSRSSLPRVVGESPPLRDGISVLRVPISMADQAVEMEDLKATLADRDFQIARLKTAGDALGVDQRRPGWQRRWADWMKAKGF